MLRTALIGTGAVALVGAVGLTSYNVGVNNTSITTVAQPEGEMDQNAMMEMMMKAGQPGEHHKNLDFLVGTWNAVTEFQMAPGEFEEGKGTMNVEWVLDGRFVMLDFESEFAGMPFTGLGYSGYNNNTNEYVGTWMDSMSTGIYYHTGERSADGTMTMEGMNSTPMGEAPMRIVSKKISDDKFVDTFYDKTPEGWTHHGTITYTRSNRGMVDD